MPGIAPAMEGALLMQRIYDFDFYEHDEDISIPPSFKHIASQDDGTYVYGNHTYGRSIQWGYVTFFNRHGWMVKKIWKSDGKWVVCS